LKRNCKVCHKEFNIGYQVPPHLDYSWRYWAYSFCSLTCEELVKKQKKLCKICGCEFYKSNKKRVCCSLPCTKISEKLKRLQTDKRRGKIKKPWSKDEFRKHIESQFTSEFNWNNHGKVWEVDHLIP
jgi:hypothetical protein